MNYFTLPNIISYLRVILSFYAFIDFYFNRNHWLFLIYTVLGIALDGLDGIVARKFNLATPFGAKLDIFCDRIVELAYWLFFAIIGRLHIWVFLFFLIRGITVDYLTRKDDKPLGDSFLRGSRFMRALYGSLKILSFGALIMIPNYAFMGINLALAFTYLTVLVCFLRAYPVLHSAIRIKV